MKRTINAVRACQQLQELVSKTSDIYLVVDVPCPPNVETIEKLAKHNKARLAIALHGQKFVTLLDDSNPSRTECSGNIRNAINVHAWRFRRIAFVNHERKVSQIGSTILRKRICGRTLT